MSSRLASGSRDLQALFGLGRVGDWTDAQLLDCFKGSEGHDSEAAFTTLVRRHGPMVLRVCRGVLKDEHDAQDAFQATFLVLARGASSVRDRSSVAGWLFGVSHRVSSRAKVALARRRTHERRAALMIDRMRQEGAGDSHVDRSALDEEIRKLPEKYREPIVLCYIEGLSQEQAAAHLGWPSGTVRGRLCKARNLLRARLARRGLVVPAAAIAVASTARETLAAVPTSLVDSTVRAAMLSGAGKAVAAGAASSTVAALANGTALSTTAAWLKLTAVLVGIGLASMTVPGAAGYLGQSRNPPAAESPEPKSPDFVPPPRANPRVEPEAVIKAAPVAGLPNAAKPPVDPKRPPRNPSVLANPMGAIAVDGELEDWPDDIEFHPILKRFSDALAGAEIPERTAPKDENDLAAWFSVGYSREEQMLYVAMVVRDDVLIVGNSSDRDTDAAEVYVDGLRQDRKIEMPESPWFKTSNLSEVPVHQYISIPGRGRIYGTPYKTNPILLAGDLDKTKSKAAFRRKGLVTTYEWAIQVFDRYPDRPTELVPGKSIGFDLAVVDKDVAPGTIVPPGTKVQPDYDWIYWGPRWKGMKVLDAGNLGELVLGGAR
ncbi:sigma-70 family RNA polymerase sigma factor [Isosphaeraceae bacterium EP7]